MVIHVNIVNYIIKSYIFFINYYCGLSHFTKKSTKIDYERFKRSESSIYLDIYFFMIIIFVVIQRE